MAVMHPVDIENYDYTPTEKEISSLQRHASPTRSSGWRG